MSQEDDFEQIAHSMPDLAAMDDGLTVTISSGGKSVSLTRVEYDGWVRHLTEHILSRPKNWLEGIAPFAEQPPLVHQAVVRESFMCLADVAFECDNLLLIPELFRVMNSMVLYTRSVQQ